MYTSGFQSVCHISLQPLSPNRIPHASNVFFNICFGHEWFLSDFLYGIMPKRVRLRAAGMMDDTSDWELWKEHSHIDILCKIAFIPSTFRLKAVLYACKYSQLVRSCWDGLFHFSHPLTVLVTPACDCCVLWYKLPFHGFLKAFFLFVLWTL